MCGGGCGYWAEEAHEGHSDAEGWFETGTVTCYACAALTEGREDMGDHPPAGALLYVVDTRAHPEFESNLAAQPPTPGPPPESSLH